MRATIYQIQSSIDELKEVHELKKEFKEAIKKLISSKGKAKAMTSDSESLISRFHLAGKIHLPIYKKGKGVDNETSEEGSYNDIEQCSGYHYFVSLI